MLKLLIFSGAVACILALPEGMVPQLDGRIVGGEPTTISQFPWQISLQRDGVHSCGGSIFSPKVIVTAAHCLQNVRAFSLKVRAGSSYCNRGGTLVRVAAFKNHEGYNARTMANDIGIVYLKYPLTMSSTIKSIPLATTTPADGTIAAVSGWGRTSFGGSSPTEIMYVDLDIVSKSNCSSAAYGYGPEVEGNVLCAYTVGKDSCQGDSGGPMVSGAHLVGVVSWGYGCAFPNYPGVYTDAAAYNDWVVKTASSFEVSYLSK